MKVSMKNLSETEVCATISVDAKALDDARQVAIVRLSKDVKVAGFRKGKAPASAAIKAIDPAMLEEETVNNAISKSIAEGFMDSDFRALDRPAVEVKKYVPGESLEYTAMVEILPKVTLGKYKKLKSLETKVEVAEKEVDEIIERIKQGFATKKEVKRAAKMGDEATIDFTGYKDGEAFKGGEGKDYPLTLGAKQFIPGFEEGIVGHKAGEEFDLELKFPKDYASKDLAGKDTVFKVILKKVSEIELPELDDELAQKAGPFKTAADLKADIKREMTDQKKREADEKNKEELVKQLVECSEAAAPKILVKDQATAIERDFSQNLMYQGKTLEDYVKEQGFKNKEEWLEKEINAKAEERVKAGLVLAELSKVEKIEGSTKELQERVESYKKQYANNPDMQKQFDTPEAQRDIANRMITEKTVERLVELNKK